MSEPALFDAINRVCLRVIRRAYSIGNAYLGLGQGREIFTVHCMLEKYKARVH